MKLDRMLAAWLRPLAGLLAVVAALALGGCGGGSGAPNNPYAPFASALTVVPEAPTIYSQIAAKLTISGGVAPYQAFSSNSAVLPVQQYLPGDTLTLLAVAVSQTTSVTITIRDSAGSQVLVGTTVLPSPPSELVVLPSSIDVYSTIASILTISGGVPPYRAFSNNSNVLPVAQNVSGYTLMLLASDVAADTSVVVTIQDSVGQTVPVNVTVHPKAASGPPLVVLPNSITTSPGTSVTVSISGGTPPYRAYSSNPAVLPVDKDVTGNSLELKAEGVSASTNVAITIQDSTGQTANVAVVVNPDTAVPLVVLPANSIVFSGVPTALSVTGGVKPYRAFSSNAAVLPVTQNVAGDTIALLPGSVAADTSVTVTVQDSGNATVSATVTVRAATLLNTLTITPNATDCGENAICSGQTGTATVQLQLPGGGPAAGRQVRFDVVAGPYGIVTNGAPPTQATVPSLVVVSDAGGNAQVIIRANVDAPTQPAQIRVTDLTSGQQITGSFLIQQRTDGATLLTVVPSEANITGAFTDECSTGFRVDYFIYGGTPPYRITQTFPTAAILINSTVNASGGFFSVQTNGTCVNPEQFSIVDATGRQITATLNNVPGTVARPVVVPPDLVVIPGDLSAGCSAGGTSSIGGQQIPPSFWTFTYVISGGTAPYNVSIAARPADDTTILTPSTGFVPVSGGSIVVSNVSQSIVLNFIDSSRPQKSTTRTITCN